MNFNYFEVFITISANNVESLVDFYSHLFQKQPKIHRPSVYAEFELNKLRIGIFKPKKERKAEFENTNSSMSLCIEVENLEQAIATLTNLGCTPPGSIIKASHGREIYAYDPAGNRLILHQTQKRN